MSDNSLELQYPFLCLVSLHSLQAVHKYVEMQGGECCSIQWGAWSVGMAAANPAVLQTLTRQGYGALQPAAGLLALQSVVKGASSLLSSNIMISLFSWSNFLKGMSTNFKAEIA